MSAAATPRPNFWDVPEHLVTGAWRAKRHVASLLREVVSLCVTTDAPEDVMRAVEASIAAANAALSAYPGKTFREAYASVSGREEAAVFADRGTFIGKSNPFAPPMTFAVEGDIVAGAVTFGPPYEGVPGCVHGGMVAAAFDQIFGYLQVTSGQSAMTRHLEIDFRSPTPLLVPLRLEARTVRIEGRKYFHEATMAAGDRVTATAKTVFVALDARTMREEIIGEKPKARG